MSQAQKKIAVYNEINDAVNLHTQISSFRMSAANSDALNILVSLDTNDEP